MSNKHTFHKINYNVTNWIKSDKQCMWGNCENSGLQFDCKTLNFTPIPKPATRFNDATRWIAACGGPNARLTIDKINKRMHVCSKVSICHKL